MLLAVVGIALCVGTALTVAGVRGRRTDDHPLCRRCRFDLTGRPADAERRCPECGADLSPPRAVVVGHRRRRAGVLGLGAVLSTLAVSVGGVVAYGQAHHVNWWRYAPLGYVVRQATSSDASRRRAGLAELGDRLIDGRLRGADLDRTADAGLDYQGDSTRPWDTGWGDLLEVAHAAGRLSDERWRRYAGQAAIGMFTFRVRPRVRRGDPVPYEFTSHRGRLGSRNDAVWCQPVHARLVWAGEPPQSVRLADSFPVGGDSYGKTEPRLYPFQLPRGLADGPQAVRLVADLAVGPNENFAVTHPVVTVRLDLPGTFALLPADQPSVTRVHDPSMADAVRRSVRVDGVRSSSAGGVQAGWSLVPPGPPVGLAFEVRVRDRQHDVRVGSFAVPAGTAGAQWPPQVTPDAAGTRLTGGRADVVFVSDPAAAAETVDVTRVWDGQITFLDVPVQ